ncbi:MAG: thioesterase II family protein [Mycobacteriales bacterium]
MTELDTDPWVRRFHRGPDGAPRLVCFPFAGGAANYFYRLSAALCPDVEVLAVQYPGRQDRLNEPLVDDVAVLADRIADGLLRWADRPTAFFGHSMGAVVAYEVARRWEGNGITLRHLHPSGRRAPSRTRDTAVHLRDDDGIRAEVAELGGPAVELLTHPELGPLLLPPIRNDYKAIETYRHPPGPPLTCPVTAIIGDTDPHVTRDEARAWAEHTSGPFELRVFSGGHFYLTDHQRQVAGIVRRSLTVRR